MKTITRFRKGLLATVAMSLFTMGTAAAQNGTLAETEVENTFTLNYNVNGADQPTITNNGTGDNPDPTLFLVDRLIDLTVTSTGGDVIVAPGQQDAVTNFTLINDGNGEQAYFLSVFNTVATDQFDPTEPTGAAAVVIEYDQDRNGDGTVTTTTFVSTDNSTFPILDPDEEIVVRVFQDIPSNASTSSVADDDEGEIILVADTLDSGSFLAEDADTDGNDLLLSENILADGASTGQENPNQGDDSAVGTYVISIADVTGVKTVSIFAEDDTGCDTIVTPLAAITDTAYSIPGACVEYRITVTNNDTRLATDLDVLDTLPGELTFIAAEAIGFTGGTLTEPASEADCGSVACLVSLVGASLPADDGVEPDNNNSPVGVIAIRALLK